MAGTLNKGSLVKNPKSSGGGGSASFPTVVTDSGSSLPSASGYQLNDTFLNTTDKKIYKATSGTFVLNTNVTNTAAVDLTTGIANEFDSNKTVYKASTDFLWSGNKEIKIHFKMDDVSVNGVRSIFYSLTASGTHGKYASIYFSNGKIHFALLHYEQSPIYAYKDTEIAEISANVEYYLKITKNGTSGKAELFTGGYDTNPIASVNFETEDYVQSGATTSTLGTSTNSGSFFSFPNTPLSLYLLDTTGDWLIPADLSWDSGADITDKTEVADKTNGILYLYENDELLKIGSSAPTVLTDQASTSMALAGNTIYKWTTALTSLSFASIEVSDLETVLYFTTGGTISFTDSSNLKWGGDGSAPSLEANTIYCISIRNGLAEIDTFGTVS